MRLAESVENPTDTHVAYPTRLAESVENPTDTHVAYPTRLAESVDYPTLLLARCRLNDGSICRLSDDCS